MLREIALLSTIAVCAALLGVYLGFTYKTCPVCAEPVTVYVEKAVPSIEANSKYDQRLNQAENVIAKAKTEVKTVVKQGDCFSPSEIEWLKEIKLNEK